jgi:hypothetical protein
MTSIGDIKKSINPHQAPWPIWNDSDIRAKNMGGSFNSIHWPETRWHEFMEEFKDRGVVEGSNTSFGQAIELTTRIVDPQCGVSPSSVASVLRILWRHENTLYHGSLALIHHQTIPGWFVHDVTLHDVTRMDWSVMSSSASGWMDKMPLPLMGESKHAWKEGEAWFRSQQENCLLKEKQRGLTAAHRAPAL